MYIYICILPDMADIVQKSIFTIIWQLGSFGMVQNTLKGCGKDFPTLLKNHDFEDFQKCVSEDN